MSIYKIKSTGNHILADQAFCIQHYPNDWQYVGEEQISVPPPAPPKPYEWFIDLGPFFDRFLDAKMPVLLSQDAGVKAILADVNIRKWVDLKRQDVAQALAYIGSQVPELTAQLQHDILNNPVTDEENLALRKVYFT